MAVLSSESKITMFTSSSAIAERPRCRVR